MRSQTTKPHRTISSRVLASGVLAAGLLALAGCASGPRKANEPAAAEDPQAEGEEVIAPTFLEPPPNFQVNTVGQEMPLVYRDGPGSNKFHLEDCRRLGKNPLPVPIDSAVRHLKPCGVCKPTH